MSPQNPSLTISTPNKGEPQAHVFFLSLPATSLFGQCTFCFTGPVNNKLFLPQSFLVVFAEGVFQSK